MSDDVSSLLRFGMSAARTGKDEPVSFLEYPRDPNPESGLVPELSVEDIPRLTNDYKQLRETGKLTCLTLVEMLSTAEINDSARKLGLLKRGILVFDSEHEMSVMMNHAIYNQRREGLNAAKRLLDETPPAAGTPKEEWLLAASESFHSAFMIMDCLPGFGLSIVDLLTGEPFLLADINLSQTAMPGISFASRLLCFDEFAMFTGAALPFDGKRTLKQIFKYISQHFGESTGRDDLTDEQRTQIETFITRTCLSHKTAASFITADIDDTHSSGSQFQKPVEPRTSGNYANRPKIGRNEPCPCGSGHKYKRCCGRGVR